ncbi:uracil-DNA glycosylase [Larsenimonas salina]|uniref:uracil-DNA glycosylase n=1 Tax=Larsenimonas salina TaxID=1295565 RepID=UPI002073394C|nr:uracil-DNA glycosylase [Larsenimonas salina]MCM5704027.1 uracil-DNA glycosylase [Larsenimonas salina]
MSVEKFLNELCSYHADDFFNPWSENCSISDNENSAHIRLSNLASVFNSCLNRDDVDLWVGRDLGWRGGRRTGIALVDEFSLCSYSKSFGLNGLKKATIDKPVKEQTASEIEFIRSKIKNKVVFWNVFPYHPHQLGEPFSNRSHTKKEFLIGSYFLKSMLEIFTFEKVVAIGNDASKAIASLGVDALKVRHPSYGGKKDFRLQLSEIYKIDENSVSEKENYELFS